MRILSLLVTLIIIVCAHTLVWTSKHSSSRATARDDDNLPRDGELFEGDIIMDARFRQIIRGKTSKRSVLKESYLREIKWPRGVVHYKIDPSLLPRVKFLLEESMEEFERRTCVQFKKQKHERDYILFTSKEETCFSHIGLVGGRQIVNLGKLCARLGTVEHEMLHVLGVIHEHSRPDRDQYIKVNYDNIKSTNFHDFVKYPYDLTNNLNEKFNFASIMLYSNYAFSKNDKPTLEAIKDPTMKFGQRVQFSVGDIRQINTLYKCKKQLRSPDYNGLIKNRGMLKKITYRKTYKESGIFGKIKKVLKWLHNLLKVID